MSREQEVTWRDVPGYGGRYRVSDTGGVMSFVKCSAGRALRLSPSSQGYLQVDLYDGVGGRRTHGVHRLVLQSFTDNDGLGLDVCHINHDRTDNRLSNLSWGTRAENVRQMVDANRQARGVKHGSAKLRAGQIREIRQSDLGPREIAEVLGVSRSTINKIRRRETWSHITETP